MVMCFLASGVIAFCAFDSLKDGIDFISFFRWLAVSAVFAAAGVGIIFIKRELKKQDREKFKENEKNK